MRVKLEPDSAFIGKKFGWIFFGIIFTLNLLFFIWFFLFSNLIQQSWSNQEDYIRRYFILIKYL